VLIALTLGAMQLFVEWLPQNKPISEMLMLGAAGVISLTALVKWELRCANPILPLDMFTHRSLVPLFVLSLMMGFCMFAVMYYAPLMFQGGFGLKPDSAGLLVTPLAVSITVGSIINGRIVTRLAIPNRMLHVGLALFCASSLALTQAEATTPHVLIATCMMLGGLGLGLLMPNLTLFVQASSPRAQLGVATAMLQSTRMIGGMLGTAIIGALVSHRYVSGINNMSASRDGAIWAGRLADPQILVNHTLAAKFSLDALLAGQDATMLLAQARMAMVEAIHSSLWVVAACLFFAFWVVRLVPPISLRHKEFTHE
jgi:predicted MFS family arabinose efflux permease